MDLIYDDIYHYTGYHGCASHCRLRVYTAPGQAVVIATEVEDNPGTSITNRVEQLATQVWQAFGLPLEALTWIEHYRLSRYIGEILYASQIEPLLITSCEHSQKSLV